MLNIFRGTRWKLALLTLWFVPLVSLAKDPDPPFPPRLLNMENNPYGNYVKKVISDREFVNTRLSTCLPDDLNNAVVNCTASTPTPEKRLLNGCEKYCVYWVSSCLISKTPEDTKNYQNFRLYCPAKDDGNCPDINDCAKDTKINVCSFIESDAPNAVASPPPPGEPIKPTNDGTSAT